MGTSGLTLESGVYRVTSKFTREEYFGMVERPELTRKILEYFASDDIGFPANIYVSDLQDVFPGEDHDVLAYHVWCAGDAGLLLVNMQITHGLDGVQIGSGPLTGLTALGQEYVKLCQAGYWDGALRRMRKAGQIATTRILADLLPQMARRALGIGE